MANIHDYLRWRGDLTLDMVPFNEVDALILAKLSYIPFERILLHKRTEPISIREASVSLLAQKDLADYVHFQDDMDFLRELSESVRFYNMQLSNYINKVKVENQTQFSAVTIKMDEQAYYLSFRGTDATLVGWKENFSMSFTFPVPAQKSARKYLEEISDDTEGTLILGGHSKGGNMAMYAAAFCDTALQDRISTVYNFDGPGFDGKVLLMPECQRICGKIKTFVPQSSIVGMMLEHEEQYTIIKSSEKFGVMQHDLSSWEVERDHLCWLDHVTGASLLIDRTLKGWLAEMDVGQREKFVDALYSILEKTQARTVQELDERWFECTVIILSTLSNLDEDTRKLITEALSLLIKNAKKNFEQMNGIWSVRKYKEIKKKEVLSRE